MAGGWVGRGLLFTLRFFATFPLRPTGVDCLFIIKCVYCLFIIRCVHTDANTYVTGQGQQSRAALLVTQERTGLPCAWDTGVWRGWGSLTTRA